MLMRPAAVAAMILRYLDPPECRCTDCLIGEAIPLDWAGQQDAEDVSRGRIQNRSGFTVREIQRRVTPPGLDGGAS